MKDSPPSPSMTRKRFSSEQKFKIVKEHLTTKTPISELCKKYGMSAKSFYDWQERFFAAALGGFDQKRGPQPRTFQDSERVKQLESDCERMKDVIAEITAENIAFKKKNLVLYR